MLDDHLTQRVDFSLALREGVFKLPQLTLKALNLLQTFQSILVGFCEWLRDIPLLLPDFFAVRGGLKQGQPNDVRFHLFLILNALVDLILKIGQAFDLDLFMSQVFQGLTLRFELRLFGLDLRFQQIILFFELVRSRQFLESLSQFLRRILAKAKLLQLRLEDNELLDIKGVN